VAGALTSAVGPLDTSHSLTNVRIEITGEKATARSTARGLTAGH
jgi:hypothetical protein